MYVVHDHITLKTYECEDHIELKDTLESIFDLDEDGVQEAINTIVRDIGDEYVGDDEEFLNISVEIV